MLSLQQNGKRFDEVEEGKNEWVEVIDEFYKGFEKRLGIAEEEMGEVEIKDEPAGEDL